MSSSTYREIWKRLSEVSQSCRDLVTAPMSSKRPQLTSPANTQPGLSPALVLAVPANFTAFLKDLKLPPTIRAKVETRIHEAVEEQKALHEKKYRDVCDKLLGQPSSSLKHIALFEGLKASHERSFERQLHQIREGTERVYAEISTRVAESKKPAFNSEYTPVLEQYFEYNAYPSARDRELLARKSSMSPRQIEVWFQNHRRRARQEGRSLKRISTDPLPANISLSALKEQMPAFMMRKHERRSPSPTEPTQNLPSPTPTPAVPPPEFSLDEIPSSASSWPTAYSLRGNVTLSVSRFSPFEAPVWYRKPSSSPPPRSLPSPSIDDLCSDLRSKLHIGGPAAARKQRDCTEPARSVATRRRYAAPRPVLSSTPASKFDTPVGFGSTSSLRSRKRHQPYNPCHRKHPNWSLDKPKPDLTLSCPGSSHCMIASPIPRTPSLTSISSSNSSYSSDPPTPRDSPYSSSIRALPEVIETLDGEVIRDSFGFSIDTITPSYPSSTERYTSYLKPMRSPSLSTSSPDPRFVTY
uniref:Homeodomain mating-type protein n=1 Tax=Coprinellus disseminatus TaxID=71703 RepID=Q1WMN4_COPDI|nr:homeodomain mating-type protein [Coprinellus disseminatus]